MRILLATLFAPLAVPATFAITILLTDPTASGAALVVGGFSLIAAYVVVLVVGLPVFFTTRKYGIRFRQALLLGGSIGLFTALLYIVAVNHAMTASKLVWFILSCSISGSITAELFRRISGAPAAN